MLLVQFGRLEWHPDDELKGTPQGTVWSCRTAGESFDLEFNRLAVAPAKSQDHRASCGVFAFGADRTPHDSKCHDGAARKKTVTDRDHSSLSVPALVEGLAQAYLIVTAPAQVSR